MTGDPESVPPLARIDMPGIEQHGYRAYPLADHLADKVVATVQRYGTQARPSTRFKDLIDIVAIVSGAELKAVQAGRALVSEAERRGVMLPFEFDVADRDLWDPGYAAEARRAITPTASTVDDALAIVRPCLDPLLTGSAEGTWNPITGRWEK